MKNTMVDLNNYLFEQLERLNDDSLTNEELEKEIKKADAINAIAGNIIENGSLAVKAQKILFDQGSDQCILPALLGVNDEK